jgi:cell pole-organizing protein PopZ
MRQVGEPSVEEILESIKKVIARDNRGGAAEERAVRETQGITPAAPGDDGNEDHVLDLAETAEYLDEDDEIDAEASASAEVPLITETARCSMRDSLTALAMLSEPGVPPQIVRSGETSLEGLTRDLLRPMLADWLDKNLPPLVERMVASEIARIVGKKG